VTDAERTGDASADAELIYDELAGVVDLFGALTREELERALEELAFKRGGQSADAEALASAVDDAVDRYYLVAYEPSSSGGDGSVASDDVDEPAGRGGADDRLLAPGPVAFPALPEHAEDLPHILDVEERAVDMETLGERARDRFRRDAARAVDDGDAERTERLLDVSYDLEAWAPVDVSAERERLSAALGGADGEGVDDGGADG
jgi:hypothetical protein